MNEGIAVKTAREKVSVELLRRTGELADRAQSLVGKVAERLQPVLNPSPGIERDSKPIPEQVWPPLFSELREQLNIINNALGVISETVDRVEV